MRFTLSLLLLLTASSAWAQAAYETLTFHSADGLEITADLYRADGDADTPIIVLCHQAGWSRGEYRQIAPRLVEMGFHCLAIDQRSGGETENVVNETAQRAKAANKPTGFIDAEQDIVAAVEFAHENLGNGKLLLWGSSYSAALSLRIAGEHPEQIDGVLAFAPGEYFGRFGKPKDWIARSAANIQAPAFITSAKREARQWRSIYNAIPGNDKVSFLPRTKGNHGSRALWPRFDDSEAYWAAVTEFLGRFK